MNQKLSMKLIELDIKYRIIHEILDSLKNNKGRWWTDAESKAEPPLWPTKESKIIFMSGDSNAIVDDGEGTLYFGDCGQFECPISDPELIELINAIRPKREVAKKKATPKKNYKSATWLDAFKRVADYLDGTRYALYVGGDEEWEDCSEDDKVAMKVCDEDEDRDGEQWLNWDSVKDFLTKPLFEGHADTNTDGCANIFECVARWQSYNRYQLEVGSPYLVWLIDTFGELGKVNIKKCDTPEKLMKALDKAGL